MCVCVYETSDGYFLYGFPASFKNSIKMRSLIKWEYPGMDNSKSVDL